MTEKPKTETIDKEYLIQDFLKTKHAEGGSFSPDGNHIAFLSNSTGTFQLYLTDSGSSSDPEQITHYDDAITFAEFSPTENKIIYGLGKGGDEKTQFYLYDVTTKDTHPLTDKLDSKYQWGGWSKDGKLITYSSNEINGTDFDVYVMNLEDKTAVVIFNQGGWCDSFGFSPTGKNLVVRKRHGLVDQDLYLINLEDRKAELVTSHENKAEYGFPQWLPDESGFFFSSNEERDFMGLTFYDIKHKSKKDVLDTDWDLASISITLDGKNLAVILNENGYGKLTIYESSSLKTLNNQSFPKGMIDNIHWSNDGKYLSFNLEGPTQNKNVWIWSKEEDRFWQLTHSPQIVPEEVLVEPELIHYISFDGLEVPAFLFLPKNRDGKLPTVVHIHGGPESQYRPSFNSLIQYFVYQGYAVVAPNVRGSSGYGKEYLALDDVKKRMDSVKDLESLHAYLETRHEIDSKKIALMGASYGGYMTLAGLTFYPDLWAAGVDIVGISNFVTFLKNTSSWRRSLREAEYGSLETDTDFLESISPSNFLQNMKAPLFIIHGKNDPRVPLSEAEQIHQQLNQNGTTTKMLVYDDEGHGLAKLKNRLDAYPKVVDFLNSVLNVKI